MKQLLVLFALIAVGSCSVWKGGLRVRFDVGINFGGSFFFDLPRTVSGAVSEGWTVHTQPDGLPVTSVTMYCYADRVVCTFYDDAGDVAGVQVGLRDDQFTPQYDLVQTGFTLWTVNGTSYWTLQQYFTTEEILSARRQRANHNQITENGGVWVVGPNKEVLHIANSTNVIQNDGIFTRQACIPWMGRHYFYKMDQNWSCDVPVYPWFALVESGELIATGLLAPGKLNLPSGQRLWFESPSATAVRAILTDGPECIPKNVETYGIVTMHIYYIDQPWLISCIFQYILDKIKSIFAPVRNLELRFDLGINFGGSFFFDLPRTVSGAVSEGWTVHTQPDGLPVTSVTMYCYADRVVCTFYDDAGDVAGIQVGLRDDQFTPQYDLVQTGFTLWTVNGTSYWTIQQYFTTEEILSARRQRANHNQITENGGVWVVGHNKEVLHIANSTNVIQNDGIFTRQACIPWMGRHYFYKMDQNWSCDVPVYPWFALVESGELVATGLLAPGKLNLPSGQRLWFESPSSSAVRRIVTDGPECIYNNIDTYGVVSMHIYYIDQPWLISCIFQ